MDLFTLHHDRVQGHFDQVPYPDAPRRRLALGRSEARIVADLNFSDATLGELTEADSRHLVLEGRAGHLEWSSKCLIEDAICALLLLVDVENVAAIDLSQLLPRMVVCVELTP